MVAPKNVLVTGSSSGFGRLAAQRLLDRGHTVVLGLRGGEHRARDLFKKDVQLWGTRLHAVDLHMDRVETIELAKKLIETKLAGRLDALINNAGYGLFGSLEDQGLEELRAQFEVNFFGLAALTQSLIPLLRASRGRIITVGSAAGISCLPMYGTYAATKHALEGLHEGLWYDLRPHGVQVALVQPGGFKTEFAVKSRIFGKHSESPGSVYAERTRALKRSLGGMQARLGNPMRVAKLLTRLVEQRRIRLRYPIGFDATALVVIKHFVPDQVRVWITNLVFRILFFRGVR